MPVVKLTGRDAPLHGRLAAIAAGIEERLADRAAAGNRSRSGWRAHPPRRAPRKKSSVARLDPAGHLDELPAIAQRKALQFGEIDHLVFAARTPARARSRRSRQAASPRRRSRGSAACPRASAPEPPRPMQGRPGGSRSTQQNAFRLREPHDPASCQHCGRRMKPARRLDLPRRRATSSARLLRRSR